MKKESARCISNRLLVMEVRGKLINLLPIQFKEREGKENENK